MMYWIVFALFTSVETFADFFLSFWFPFYYELKICLLIWLLSPATKGTVIPYLFTNVYVFLLPVLLVALISKNLAVLWIRIRINPELLPGSGSGIIVPDLDPA